MKLSALIGIAALLLASVAGARPSATVIRLLSVATFSKTVDVPPKGPSLGDYVVLDDNLMNAVAQFGKKKGALVGSDHAVEKNVGNNRASIDGVARLPGGTIHFKGLLKSVTATVSTVRVVGGTGKYASVTGTLAIENLDKSGYTALNVYSLNLLPTA